MKIVGTDNARTGLIKGIEQLKNGASAIDAVESAINVIENDPEDFSVGIGGFPNLLGEIELDASIMCGRTLRCGAVAAVKHYQYPISIARKVMELSPHVFLVGEGAERFAAAVGFKQASLSTEMSEKNYIDIMTRNQLEIVESDPEGIRDQKKWHNKWLKLFIEKKNLHEWHRKLLAESHGTVNVIALDQGGNLCSGISTSGNALKFPGRVGDSPIIGAGNYADSRYGAATCIGEGELAIRLAIARIVVEDLKRGDTPEQAALNRIQSVKELSPQGSLDILVLNKEGNAVSATTEMEGIYFVMDASMEDPQKRKCLTL
ncbi:MAG: N(4)-(beta-N-acetylglucosaminyl)-L-asparaginase [Candidatus Heimdallarchaeota archaeon]